MNRSHTLQGSSASNMLVARASAGVLFAALLAAACAPGAQAASHGANCQDGIAGAVAELALDEAGAGVLQMCLGHTAPAGFGLNHGQRWGSLPWRHVRDDESAGSAPGGD
jgi:hypothetical protein